MGTKQFIYLESTCTVIMRRGVAPVISVYLGSDNQAPLPPKRNNEKERKMKQKRRKKQMRGNGGKKEQKL